MSGCGVLAIRWRAPAVLAILAWSGAARAEPPPHALWEMTFKDEFDGAGVDWAVWDSDRGPRGADLEGRWPENNVVRDGVLDQVTRREQPPRGGKDWSTAHIWTRAFTQQYGYFEARMRYGRYLNNAFWLYRPKGKRFPDPPHFEIDINEGHTPRELAMTLHMQVPVEGAGEAEQQSTGRRWDAPMDLDRDFHLYGCEWDEKEIVWYFDGRPVRRLQNPMCHAPADVRLSTVIMPRQLDRDGVKIDTMEGASMAVDWVRGYRKVKQVRAAELPPLEPCVPRVISLAGQQPRVAPAARSAEMLNEVFSAGAAGPLPAGWRAGSGKPAIAPWAAAPGARSPREVLRLGPGDYAFRMLDAPVTGRMEVEFDCLTPGADGLLFVTLGKFDASDPNRLGNSYYTGDIGPYILWKRNFINSYTERDKWLPFARWKAGAWGRVRIVLDIAKGVFDCYGGAGCREFLGGGVFRGHPKAACGIGLRHHGSGYVVAVDNLVVRTLGD